VLSARRAAPFSVATLRPRPNLRKRERRREIARRIDKAGNVVIMCGAGCRGAADVLRALSDVQGPACPYGRGKELMAYDDHAGWAVLA